MQLYAMRLLGNQDQVLLYKAPRHNGFMLASYLAGFCIVTYAGSNGAMFLQTPTTGNINYVKYLLTLAAAAAGMMGCALATAPLRLLRSVRIVRVGSDTAALQFTGKRPFPLIPDKTWSMKLGNVWSDQNIPKSLRTGHSVRFENADLWTNGQLTNPASEHFKSLGLFQKFVHISAGVMPSLKRNVRRMFNREGMVYLRIGSQNWKLDLQGCEILESGEPLNNLIEYDPAVKGTIYSMIRRQLPS